MDRYKNVDVSTLEQCDMQDVDRTHLYINENEQDPNKLWNNIKALRKQLENVKLSRMLYWEANMQNSLTQCDACDRREEDVRDTDRGIRCLECYVNECQDSDDDMDSNDDEPKDYRDDFELFNSIYDFDINKVETWKYVV